MIEAATRASAAGLERELADATPAAVVVAARNAVAAGRLAVVSSFGTEAAVLLSIVAAVDRSIPVIFLDTGWLFEETIAYRDELAARLELTDVRTITPAPAALAERDPRRDLWFDHPDACCALRKVEPLARALAPFDAWINGRKRYHGAERLRLPVVETDGRRLKFTPLARVSEGEIAEIFRSSGLPRHPLAAAGYRSVGCMPCTSRTDPGEDIRAGRWRGRGKTECGIHSVLRMPAGTLNDPSPQLR